jgi:hypothetical protein
MANTGAGATCSQCLAPAPAGAIPQLAATPRPRGLRPLALVVAVLLVVGVLAAIGQGGNSTAADEKDDDGSELRALIPELQEEVERLRGLEFKKPVDVELLSDAEFRKRLTAESKRDAEALEDLKTTERLFRALKLIDGDVDLEEAVDSLLGAAVAGFYDPEDDELVVRGTSTRPSVRATLVHELVHALQDQHFELHRPDLVEGDATRVQELYVQSLPVEEQKRAQLEEAQQAGGIDPSVPRVLLELVAFPYVVGPRFATEVLAQGGQPRLDAAFAEPPQSSEHLLHPERFLSGERMAEVVHPRPPSGREVIDEGVFGELGLILIVGPRAAVGWGGDWYVAWDEDDRTCIRTTVAMDSAQEAQKLRRAVDDWAERHGDVEIENAEGPLTFTACG